MTTEEVDALRALVLAQQRELEACRPLNDWYRESRVVAKFDQATQIFTISINVVPFVKIVKHERDYEMVIYNDNGASYSPISGIDGMLFLDRARTKDAFRMFIKPAIPGLHYTALGWKRRSTYGFFGFCSQLIAHDDKPIFERGIIPMEAEQIFAELERAAIAWGVREGTRVGPRGLGDISEIKSAKY